MSRRLRKVLWKTLLVVAAAGALGLGLLVATLRLDNSSLELPRPTGPFAVGRVSTTWVAASRVDPFAPPPAQKRELVVWIWYPARRSDRSQTAEDLPGSWQRAVAAHAGMLLTQFLFGFSDDPLIQSRILRSVLVALGGPGGLDSRTGLASTARYVREFFDVHLRGAPREALCSGPLVAGARFEAR